MRHTLRSLLVAATVLVGGIVHAQPLPPFQVTVNFFLEGCPANATGNLQTQPGTLPALDIDFGFMQGSPLGASGCHASLDLLMDSFSGSFVVTVPCSGAVLTDTVDYQINTVGPDSAHVLVWLDCGASSGPDCLGVIGGTALPGTPCWTPGTNFIGTWDANCNCTSGGGLPCQAGFWVIQAYGQDSLPVPNEVWVWNLSTGTGALTYLWNFGDGTISTDPYPTHTYSQNGPYQLCLTIADASGCTSTTCDTISIDEDGLLNGMMLGGHLELDPARTDGFTLNIQNPLTTSMAELQDLSRAAIWPNPSNGDLDLALVSVADGPLRVSFFDVNGREVRQESRAMNAGRSQHNFDITDLPSGIYTLRATDRNGTAISIRFVKAE